LNSPYDIYLENTYKEGTIFYDGTDENNSVKQWQTSSSLKNANSYTGNKKSRTGKSKELKPSSQVKLLAYDKRYKRKRNIDDSLNHIPMENNNPFLFLVESVVMLKLEYLKALEKKENAVILQRKKV